MEPREHRGGTDPLLNNHILYGLSIQNCVSACAKHRRPATQGAEGRPRWSTGKPCNAAAHAGAVDFESQKCRQTMRLVVTDARAVPPPCIDRGRGNRSSGVTRQMAAAALVQVSAHDHHRLGNSCCILKEVHDIDIISTSEICPPQMQSPPNGHRNSWFSPIS